MSFLEQVKYNEYDYSGTLASFPRTSWGVMAICERGPFTGYAESPEDFRRKWGKVLHRSELPSGVANLLAVTGGGGCKFNLPLPAVRALEYGARLFMHRIVHRNQTTGQPSSAQATVDLYDRSSTEGPAETPWSAAGTFAVVSGDTLVFKIDGGTNYTATIAATQGKLTSAAQNFNITGSPTIQVQIDGGATQTITLAGFTSGAATAQEVVNSINPQLVGAQAYLSNGSGVASGSGTYVTLRSDRFGTGSRVKLVGGTGLTGLGFTSGAEDIGTGNVSNAAAATAAEIAAIITAATGGTNTYTVATGTGANANKVAIVSDSSGGSSTVEIVSGNLVSKLGFTATEYEGTEGPVATIQVDALYHGTYANYNGTTGVGLQVLVSDGTINPSTEFKFQVAEYGIIVETFDNLSMDPTAERYFPNILNAASTYIRVTDLFSGSTSPDNRPLTNTIGSSDGRLASGNDGLTGMVAGDYIGQDLTTTTGYVWGAKAFNAASDILGIAAPGICNPSVVTALETYVRNRKDCVLFWETPPTDDPTPAIVGDALSFRAGTSPYSHLKIDSTYAGAFFGHPKVLHPIKNNQEFISNLGDVIGIYASTIDKFGFGRAAAGLERGRLQNLLGFDYDIGGFGQSGLEATLAEAQINRLCVKYGVPVIWGEWTNQQIESSLSDFHARLLMIITMKTLIQAAAQSQFDPNDPITWRRVKKRVDPFFEAQITNRNFGAVEYTGDLDAYIDQKSGKWKKLELNLPDDLAKGKYKVRLKVQVVPSLKEFTWDTYLTKYGAAFGDLELVNV